MPQPQAHALLSIYSAQLHANELLLHIHAICASLLCVCGIIKGAIITLFGRVKNTETNKTRSKGCLKHMDKIIGAQVDVTHHHTPLCHTTPPLDPRAAPNVAVNPTSPAPD